MVKTKNSAVKVVAFMLVLALVVSLLAFITPKQTAQVQAATLDREPGLYEAGTTNQTHTWDECLAKILDGKFENQYGWQLAISTANADWFEGDLVLGSFVVDEITNLSRDPYASQMFRHCKNLVNVDVSKADFGVVDTVWLFQFATSVESVNLGVGFKCTTSVNACSSFFSGCTNLKTITGSFDLSNIEDNSATFAYGDQGNGVMVNMFENWSSLETIDLTSLFSNANNIWSTYKMFSGCTSLKTAIIGNTLSDVQYLKYMFSGCTSLTKVTLEVPNDCDLDYTFQNCTSLESVDFSKVKLMAGEGLNTTFDGMTIKRIILGPEGMVVGGYRDIAAYLPTAPSGAHYAFTDEPATAITEIYSAGCGKTIELFSDADNKSLAPAQETPVVPSTGVVSNTVAIVIVAMSVIALAVVSKKKKVAR